MPHTKLSVRVEVSGFPVEGSSAILCLPSRDKRDQPSGLSALLRNIQGCGEDLRIGSATAEIAADGMLHVVQSRIRIAIQQRCAAHHHARCAKTTLHRVMFHEGSLHLVHRIAVRQALDGRNLATDYIDGQCHARERRRLVDPNRTCRARAAVADNFGSGQVQVVAQGFCKSVTRLDDNGMLMPVDIQLHGDRVRTHCPVAMRSFRLAGQCIRGLDDGRSGCNASTLQKSTTRKLSLGTICHGNGLSDVESLNRLSAAKLRPYAISTLYI